MSDLGDFEISGSTEADPLGRPPELPGPRSNLPIVGIVLLVAAAAGVGYFVFRKPAPPRPAPAASPEPAAPSAQPTTSTPTPAIHLPALDESDALVRQLAKGLSAHPQLALWLATDGLVRRLAAVVTNIADREPPRPHLGFLAPKGGFGVIRKAGRVVIDPKSYQRYDAFGEVVASLDAPGGVRVYRQLEPLFDAAYRDLGHPEGGFSKVLARALTVLGETPRPDGDVPVREVMKPILVYEYVDARLEALSPGQKHLLRMGPGNMARVQDKLRELSDALARPEGQ